MSAPPVRIRAAEPGDLGWILMEHGSFYRHHLGFGAAFEARVARIVADYLDRHDPGTEGCWLAVRDGADGEVRTGSVMCVGVGDDRRRARLRLLLVRAGERGAGVGAALVDHCVRFATDTGYAEVELSTVDVLLGARRLYERAGFSLTHAEPDATYGRPVLEETWLRSLGRPAGGPESAAPTSRR